MIGISQELKQSLDQYDDMQSLHLQSISNYRSLALDMKSLNFQRSRAFEYLKNQLRCHPKGQPTDGTETEKREVMDRLGKIINTEKMIARLTSEYQQRIVRQKSRMQQGQKALKGYGNTCISNAT